MSQDNRFAEMINRILADTSRQEAQALFNWTTSLLALRHSAASGRDKLGTLIRLTREAPILFPLIKRIALELKKTGWDEASWKSRLGTGAALWAGLALANAGAGLAVLGGAIALPLWIVFGSGDQFARTMLREIKRFLSR